MANLLFILKEKKNIRKNSEYNNTYWEHEHPTDKKKFFLIILEKSQLIVPLPPPPSLNLLSITSSSHFLCSVLTFIHTNKQKNDDALSTTCHTRNYNFYNYKKKSIKHKNFFPQKSSSSAHKKSFNYNIAPFYLFSLQQFRDMF